MNYILDTNVISELVAAQPNQGMIEWIQSIDPESVFLSVITIGELKKGIEKLPDSQRRTTLENWLANDLLVRFRQHLLPIDTAVMLEWGRLMAQAKSRGKPISAMDSLMAATAAQSGFTLVTRNIPDFEYTGVTLFNLWGS